jgi:hypothetical protein
MTAGLEKWRSMAHYAREATDGGRKAYPLNSLNILGIAQALDSACDEIERWQHTRECRDVWRDQVEGSERHARQLEADLQTALWLLTRLARASEAFLRETYADGYVPTNHSVSEELHEALRKWRESKSSNNTLVARPSAEAEVARLTEENERLRTERDPYPLEVEEPPEELPLIHELRSERDRLRDANERLRQELHAISYARRDDSWLWNKARAALEKDAK